MSNRLRTRIKEGENKPTRYYSKKQEDSVAKELGGKRTSNSGATLFSKGDVNTSDFLIECKTKTTLSNSISIKREWIDKNIKESLFMGKKYCSIAFNFGPDQPNYYIIDEYLMKFLMEQLKGEHNNEEK